MGTVYLVGAGPGAVDLLTVKALRLIRQADAIVYDRLVGTEILQEAQASCAMHYVGKEDNRHLLPQTEINRLLDRLAQKHRIVVRLKGGDPFVFGRGGEEGIYLYERGIPFELVPGVTSAIAVPEYAGIPVTHRGVASGFRVVTGHETDKERSQIVWEAFRNEETLIFLMGLHRIDTIVRKLIEIGKPRECPVAVISRGTTPQQQTIVGTLDDIAERAAHLPTPAMIVVGKVVLLREKLRWFEYADSGK
jgi:uroporphyrin-III C-methyltransferase